MKEQGDRTGEFHSVQYLRGIAALAVIYFHTKVYIPDFAWPIGRQFGYGGVDLFFVVSGFIMMVTTSAKPQSTWAFYLRRIIRVVPLYWGATLTAAVLFLVIPGAFLKQTITFNHVVLSLLFIPHHVEGEIGAPPFFKIGWTLNFEMFFYLVFGLTLFWRAAWQRLLVIAILFVGLTIGGVIFKPSNPALGYYTSPFVLEFLLGGIVGHLMARGVLRCVPLQTIWIGSILATTCVLLIGGRQGDGFGRTLTMGLPAAALLAFAVATELRGSMPRLLLLERLGNASYSIYLAHPFVLTAFKAIGKALHVPSADPIVGAVGVVGAVTAAAIFGLIVYRFVEQPMLNAIRGLQRGNCASVSSLWSPRKPVGGEASSANLDPIAPKRST
jgi:peptidoglycan/LPS O-acetylase OafA/YrhL